MEPTQTENEYPHFGRRELDHAHAPYMIVRSLRRLGIGAWTSTLLNWLGRYDGLEQHLHSECDPACAVRDVLSQHVERWPAIADGQSLTLAQRQARIEAVIDDLLQLDFVAARAHWGPLMVKRIVWRPLEEDWMWFVLLGPDWESIRATEGDDHDLLQVWTRYCDDTGYKQAIRAMLLHVDSDLGARPSSQGSAGE